MNGCVCVCEVEHHSGYIHYTFSLTHFLSTLSLSRSLSFAPSLARLLSLSRARALSLSLSQRLTYLRGHAMSPKLRFWQKRTEFLKSRCTYKGALYCKFIQEMLTFSSCLISIARHTDVGFNYRLSNLLCAIGVCC